MFASTPLKTVFVALMSLCPLSACHANDKSYSNPNTTSPQTQMKERRVWAQAQAVYLTTFTVEKSSPQGEKETREFALERTPHHRLKVLSHVAHQTEEVTFLQQDDIFVGLANSTPTQMLAPWMMGFYLFGEDLSPEMLLSWSMGLEGVSFSKDDHNLKPVFNAHRLVSLNQNGWDVVYTAWSAPHNGIPALPQKLVACKNKTCLNVTINEVQVFSSPPKDYQEFQII